MDDDELKKDDELEAEEDLTDDDILLGGKGKKSKGIPEDDLDDVESIDELVALEDDEDEPYDDIDPW